MSENKVNGREDAVASEMIQQLLWTIYTITRCVQELVMGQMDAPSSWKIVSLVLSRKPRRGTKERDQK